MMIKESLLGVLRRWPLLLLSTLVGLGLGLVALHSTEATYRVDTMLIAENLATVADSGVDFAADPDGVVSGAYSDAYVPPSRLDMDVSAVGQLVGNPAVTAAVKQASGFAGTPLELARLASITAPRGTGILTVQVRYTDSAMTKKIAEAYGAELFKQAQALRAANPDFSNLQRSPVTVAEQAEIVPQQSVNLARYIVSGLVAGLALALASYYVSNSIVSARIVRATYRVPVSAEPALQDPTAQTLQHISARVMGHATPCAGDSPLVAVAALDRHSRFDRGDAKSAHVLVAALAADLVGRGYSVHVRDTTGAAPAQWSATLPSGVAVAEVSAEEPLRDWSTNEREALLVVAGDPRTSPAAAQVTARHGSLVVQARLRVDSMRDLRDAITLGSMTPQALAALHIVTARGTA